MPREPIAMSTEEVAAFIGPKPWIVLGTLDEDGSPWGDLAASLIDGERIVFAVPPGHAPPPTSSATRASSA